MARVSIRPLTGGKRGEKNRTAVLEGKTHTGTKIAGCGRDLQNPPTFAIEHGNERLRRSRHAELPKRTFKPTRRFHTGTKSRIVLAGAVLLVVSPKEPRDTPERLRRFRKDESACRGKRNLRRHLPCCLNPAGFHQLNGGRRGSGPGDFRRDIFDGVFHSQAMALMAWA